MSGIALVPIGHVETALLDSLAPRLESALRRRTYVVPGGLDPEPARDGQRLQYHAGKLLATLLDEGPAAADRVLGVTGVDLFIPIFTFLYGQAQLNGRAGLFSTHRLHNEFYGMPPDRRRFVERAVKEALHELGHTYGLRHCFDPYCVMRSSTYIEDVDQKAAEYCSSCRRAVFSTAVSETG